MDDKQLSVRLHGTPVGILSQTPTGKMVFSYNADAKQAISIGMPIREQPYSELPCEAFFGGLLPESEATRKLIGQQYGISHNNSFALLKAIGYDCAGAISFHSLHDPVAPQRSFPLKGKIVSEDELYKHIKELPRKPLFLGFEGLRLSLAGAQDKAAVCIIDNQIALPEDGCPTTHILKPNSTALNEIVENEYFCLKLAKAIGLAAPQVEIRQVKDISYLLIERYDRRILNNNVERMHQEDFCQALGIISAKKYQHEGGPSLKDCFDLLQNTTQPAIDRNMLAAGVVFNFLIGNMDAHGKNFSLLYGDQSKLTLAPFYDMVCTLAYPDLTTKMAMKIGSKYEYDAVLARHWEQLCNEINYSYPALKQLIAKLSRLILAATEQEQQKLTSTDQNLAILTKVIEIFKQQITQTLKRFEKI